MHVLYAVSTKEFEIFFNFEMAGEQARRRDRPGKHFRVKIMLIFFICMDNLMATLRLLAVNTFVVFLLVGYPVLACLVQGIGEFQKLELCNDY
ncbi:hypothetical protein EVAR_27970_1 [Eumeta japonica]|uniref:Uncharacterized protein n=1 Tax=Eumeta variegata TaxID=151549 RepID=A0A4C1WEN5_EUMVA|nr:hypothetical protein EVAR_27970_1 [Eumeta japonica]